MNNECDYTYEYWIELTEEGISFSDGTLDALKGSWKKKRSLQMKKKPTVIDRENGFRPISVPLIQRKFNFIYWRAKKLADDYDFISMVLKDGETIY